MMKITSGQAIRLCILWMDQRSSKQSEYIMETCKGDNALCVHSNGTGPISAEWLLCKVLWLYENEYENYVSSTTFVCEYQDYINYQLTKQFVASTCNAETQWHWDGIKCLQQSTIDNF
jgi:ribulose kinase